MNGSSMVTSLNATALIICCRGRHQGVDTPLCHLERSPQWPLWMKGGTSCQVSETSALADHGMSGPHLQQCHSLYPSTFAATCVLLFGG